VTFGTLGVREGAEGAVVEAASQATRERASVGRATRLIRTDSLSNKDEDPLVTNGCILNLPSGL
jgi:hypothetical protein